MVRSMTTRDQIHPNRKYRFAAQLDSEWQQLRQHRRALRQAQTWASDDADDALAPFLKDLTDLDQLLDATQGRRGLRGPDDKVMLRLVEVAQTDQLAGRIVIQRLLPGLISRSAGYWDSRDRVDPIEIAIPAAWVALRTFDLSARRRHIASSILNDAIFHAFRQPLRRASATEITRSPDSFTVTPAPEGPSGPAEELANVVNEAQAAGVPTYDLDLLRHLVRAESPSRTARERNVTPRTIRNHRDRAIGKVRQALAIAA